MKTMKHLLEILHESKLPTQLIDQYAEKVTPEDDPIKLIALILEDLANRNDYKWGNIYLDWGRFARCVKLFASSYSINPTQKEWINLLLQAKTLIYFINQIDQLYQNEIDDVYDIANLIASIRKALEVKPEFNTKAVQLIIDLMRGRAIYWALHNKYAKPFSKYEENAMADWTLDNGTKQN